MVSGGFNAAYDCARRFPIGTALVELLREMLIRNRLIIASATSNVNATATPESYAQEC